VSPRDHNWVWLGRDLAAGLTVATVAVPQAMAYALLAGVSPVYGLYTAVIMAALGSLLGSSEQLINGPTNAISLVVFGVVAGVGTGPDDPNRIGLVSLLAVLAGLIQITIALLKLGNLARLVPETVMVGFTAGAALLMASSQLPTLLGLPAPEAGGDLFGYRWWLPLAETGAADWSALLIGLATLALVAGLHHLGVLLRVTLPGLLLGLILISLLVRLLDLAPAAPPGRGLEFEAGFPTLQLPAFSWHALCEYGGSAAAIAILGLTEALAFARTLAAQTGAPLDVNRQCLAEGLANLGGGFFQCLPGSGSLTRSAINHQAGAVTRLSGIFSAAAVAAALWLFAPAARFVPPAALAGGMLWTAWRILAGRHLWNTFRASRMNAALVLVLALAAIVLGIQYTVVLGIVFSLLRHALPGLRRAYRLVALRSWRASTTTALTITIMAGEKIAGPRIRYRKDLSSGSLVQRTAPGSSKER
jgi:SulP family sulfate permease